MGYSEQPMSQQDKLSVSRLYTSFWIYNQKEKLVGPDCIIITLFTEFICRKGGKGKYDRIVKQISLLIGENTNLHLNRTIVLKLMQFLHKSMDNMVQVKNKLFEIFSF